MKGTKIAEIICGLVVAGATIGELVLSFINAKDDEKDQKQFISETVEEEIESNYGLKKLERREDND